MLRIPAVCAALLVLAMACAPGPSRGPDPAASGVERLTDGRPAPALAWSPCPDAPVAGAECAELAVPTDYRDPASPPMSLAVTRLRATDPARRRGVLLSNPGGPGAPGRWNTLGVDQVTGGRLRSSYDLVGLDVRGTGASRPAARCGLSGPLLASASAEVTATDFDADLSLARDIAATCARGLGGLERHLGTVDAARDMDLLRAALGESRLSFSGVSYGTSLGTAYASIFPDRTDRVLLDSQDDDTVGWRERFRSSNAAFDERFSQAATSIAESPRWAALGSAADVAARYLDTRARAARGELRLDGAPFDVRALRSVAEDALRNGGRYVDDLAGVLARAGGVPGAPPDRALADRLRAGTLPTQEAELGPDGLDQVAAVGFAVRCGETDWPRDPEVYRRTFERDRAAHPLSSGARGTIEPCAFWPRGAGDPLPRLTAVGHTGTPQALVLQHRADPATPWAGARRTRDALGSRAVMITVGSGGHGVLGADRCATDAAVAWLVDGVLPEADTTCGGG